MLDGFLYRQKRFWRLHGFTILLFAISGYFIYHGFSGTRGYLSWLELSEEVEVARAELAGLTAEREELDLLIAGLAPHQIDPDLLEDYLRQQGYIRDNEVILLED